MTMHTTVSTVGGSIIVVLDGSIDLAAVGTLHGDLTRVIRRHPGDSLIVDLDGIDAIDDTGLGVLLGAAAAARESGGDLEVVCNRSSLRGRLERTRFDRAVVVRATIT
jgi:anti-sigma B factor antagonist